MFRCKDLKNLPSLSKLRLVSGEGGLTNGIRWAYKAENMEFSQWVRGGELLIISSPVIRSEDFDLEKIIKEAIRFQMAGALLLVGEDYIKKITKEVLVLTNKAKFPLFVLPWDVPLVDVFEEMGHAIAYREKRENDQNDILSGIIFGGGIKEEALRAKSRVIDYDMEPPQQIFVCHLEYSEKEEDYLREMEHEIEEQFQRSGRAILLSNYSSNLVGCLRVNDKKETAEIYRKIVRSVKEKYPELVFSFGVGHVCEALEELQESFKEASQCVALSKKIEKSREALFYEQLGFYQLLLSMENTQALRTYVEQVLGKLKRYDTENRGELSRTLKTYLEQNCSLLQTAECLHTHKNTIRYRVQRIEEILGRSLTDSYTRLELYSAILISEIM